MTDPKVLDYYKPPFTYDPMGQTIHCQGANGRSKAVDIRGWGNLIGGAANNLPKEQAEHIQDEFGRWVCDAMNVYATMHKSNRLEPHETLGMSDAMYEIDTAVLEKEGVRTVKNKPPIDMTDPRDFGNLKEGWDK